MSLTVNTGKDVGIMEVHKDILSDLDVPYYTMHVRTSPLILSSTPGPVAITAGLSSTCSPIFRRYPDLSSTAIYGMQYSNMPRRSVSGLHPVLV